MSRQQNCCLRCKKVILTTNKKAHCRNKVTMSVVEFLWSQYWSETTMDMSVNSSASSLEHPRTDPDANLCSVADMDTPQ